LVCKKWGDADDETYTLPTGESRYYTTYRTGLWENTERDTRIGWREVGGGWWVCGEEGERNVVGWLANLGGLAGGVGSALVDLRNDNGDDDNDDDDEEDDEQAPPLLAVAAPCLFDGAADLCVGLDDVLVDLLALLLNVGNEGLLLLHNLIEVLEQLGELDHLALDILDGLVALLDVAEGRRGLAAAVGVEQLQTRLAQTGRVNNL
jgi:hypothetical protein